MLKIIHEVILMKEGIYSLNRIPFVSIIMKLSDASNSTFRAAIVKIMLKIIALKE